MTRTPLLPLLAIFVLAHGNNAQGDTVEDGAGENQASQSTTATEGPLLQTDTVSLQLPLQHAVALVDRTAKAASTSAELIAAWEMGLETATAITRAAEKRHFDSFGQYDNEIKIINQAVQWGYLTFYGEGQNPHFELDLKVWMGLANALPDTPAKAFFRLAELSYDNASFYGWSNIQQRTWDYGGCSPMGTGLHLKMLTQIDTINPSPPFASKVQTTLKRVRELTISDLLTGTSEFPYCNRSDPHQVAKMVAEGRTILSTIELSADERKALQQRVDSNMGLSTD
jgi:hypothetical protein